MKPVPKSLRRLKDRTILRLVLKLLNPLSYNKRLYEDKE